MLRAYFKKSGLIELFFSYLGENEYARGIIVNFRQNNVFLKVGHGN
jgi:hypothetical protein